MSSERIGYYPKANEVMEFLNHVTWKEKYWAQPQILLRKEPDIPFLRKVVSLPNEVAIYKRKYDEWSGFPGGETELFAALVPEGVKVFIHSHVAPVEDLELPSLFDLLNFFDEAKNCIISPKGLTVFSLPPSLQKPLLSPEESYLSRRRLLRMERQAIIDKEISLFLKGEVGELNHNTYVKLLRRVGVVWETIPWERLTEAKLQEIFA